MSDICLATRDASCCFEPMRFTRHAAGAFDVTLDVKFCGVCHSDIHSAKNDLLSTKYPLCPGHEVAGVVTAVGASVRKVKVGDHVGVGVYVDACLACDPCKRGADHLCANGITMTYGHMPKHGRAGTEMTTGGYSSKMVVHEHFVVSLPKSVPLERAGPLLCAGVTMWAPLKKYKVGPGSRVGISGLGGLGTMGVKIAKALGAHVTVITRSARKGEAMRALGADAVVVSSDPASVRGASGTLDLVIDTVSQRHDLGVNVLAPGGLIDLLAIDGVWAYTGLILDMQDVQPVKLLMKQIAITGTLIASMGEAQLCVDFCAKHELYPEIELVDATPQQLSRVYQLLDSGNDAGTRYVLDIAKTLGEQTFALPRARAPKLVGRTRLWMQLGLLVNRVLLAKVEGALLDRAALVFASLGAVVLAAVAAVAVPPAMRWMGK